MVKFYTRLTFLCGFLIGLLLSSLTSLLHKSISLKLFHSDLVKTQTPVDPLYEKWFKTTNLTRIELSADVLRYGNKSLFTEAQYLYNKIEVLCLILVYRLKSFVAANSTWASRCNRVESLEVGEGHGILPYYERLSANRSSWFLLCNFLTRLEVVPKWVLVVRDDTFAIVENLRHMVAGLDYTKPHYLGHAMVFWGVPYNSGEAGYVLSCGAIKRLQQAKCAQDLSYRNKEDYYLGAYF